MPAGRRASLIKIWALGQVLSVYGVLLVVKVILVSFGAFSVFDRVCRKRIFVMQNGPNIWASMAIIRCI